MLPFSLGLWFFENESFTEISTLLGGRLVQFLDMLNQNSSRFLRVTIYRNAKVENNNQGILTIIELIDERIRHIDDAIEKLEKYQENFITKCFEKAETIVRDLEKLPGLSKIKFGGKDINIIKVSFQ